MNLKISLGGDVVQYLGVVGLLKALHESNEKDYEIHCSGFSCIPSLLWFYNPNTAYNILSNMWEDSFKTFVNATTPSIKELSKNFSMIIKMQKKLDTEDSKEKLEKFVQKWIPEVDVRDFDRLKIYSYNLQKNTEEILSGDSRDAIIKAIVYPLDFSPVDSYISLSWVFGIPQGDVIIYIDWDKEPRIKKAADYLLVSTLARTFHIVQMRVKHSVKTSMIKLKNQKDFSMVSRRFYEFGIELFSKK
ncbi:MAG: hypothetical protein ACK4R7_01180 [Fervidobacterium sp.]